MPGRMGTDRVTVKNLVVVDIKKDEDLVAVSGPVPGISKNVLLIQKIGEGKLSELVEEVPEAQVQQVEEEIAEGTESETEQKNNDTKGTETPGNK
jgi:hypothetical protein